MKNITFLVSFGLIALLWLGADSKPIEDITDNSLEGEPEKRLGPIHQLIKLLPAKKMEEIVQTHLKTDNGFREAIIILKSDEFSELVEKLKAAPEFQKISKVMEKFNFNVTQAGTCLMNYLKKLDTPPSPTGAEVTPSLELFVTEVQGVLPFGEIAKVIGQDPEAKKLREDLSSEELRQVANALHNAPEMVELRNWLKDKIHFDIDPYVALIHSFLGWQLAK